MARYVAFVRAINVAGHAKVRMTSLAEAFVAAGCEDVRTLIQSGNVVFDAGARKEAAVFRAIHKELSTLVSDEVVIMFRSLAHMRELAKQTPFGEAASERGIKLYVAFLAREPGRTPAFPIVSAKERLEAVGKAGLDVFMISRRKPNGMYGFPNNFIEAAVGVPATTRTGLPSRRWRPYRIERRRAALASPVSRQHRDRARVTARGGTDDELDEGNSCGGSSSSRYRGDAGARSADRSAA